MGMQSAALGKVEIFTSAQIEKFITTEEGALWQVEKFKEVINKGGKGLGRLL
jgi:hypothetical protein